MLTKISHQLKTNKILNFLSSLKLAVPLMIALAAIVAVGTIYESLYNSDYAKIKVYHTLWFEGLLALLWINIFLSTLSRWPFQKHHIGFVITHLGLLTLLAGGLITGEIGIDGLLRVPEGGKSSSVSLTNVVLGYQFSDSPKSQFIELPRSLQPYQTDPNSFINREVQHLFTVQEYLPFTQADRIVTPDDTNTNSGVGLSFRLKSPFFQVSEWLHSKENPMMQMGPAKVYLKIGTFHKKTSPHPSLPNKKMSISKSLQKKPDKVSEKIDKTAKIIAMNIYTNHALGEISLQELKNKNWKIKNLEIQLVKVFSKASVSQNKLVEGVDTPPNPALEIKIIKGAEKLREVLYAKYPNFSLQQNGVDGLKFIYNANLNTDINTDPEEPAPSQNPHHEAPDIAISTNVIEFWVDPTQSKETAHVVLLKQGEVVLDKEMALGETFTTPWMGITITLANIIKNGLTENSVTSIEPVKGMPLPPSALKIHLTQPQEGGRRDFWLIEDSSQLVSLNGREAQIFYGQKSLELPFEIHLKKFTKVDYPGTETPMSFESQVQVMPTGETSTISMNEPFKKDGYTVYQASYVVQPGQAPESIFSVNKDPGRPIKYLGSLILSLGIIIFTVMRSDWYKQRSKKPS